MPTRRFERIALAQLSLSGCAVVFGVCVLSEHAQAQLSVPTGPIPAPPTQSPTLNPPNPGTVPSSALHADHAFNAKHHAFNTKHHSKC
jgi:hypothetical protein